MKANDIDVLKAIIHRSRWCLEELVVDQKDQEANALISGGAKDMVKYLVSKFGSVQAVVAAAQDMRKAVPAKTLTVGRR